MNRIAALMIMMLGLAACAEGAMEADKPVDPIGNFKMGHLAVVAPEPEKLLISRDATPEEWIDVVDAAFEKRFRMFEGDKFYHIGLSVEAYSLPPPVVPGKSALAMRLTVWEDATQAKLNEETKIIQVIKVFESRISKSREEVMQGLAEGAVDEVEKFLREQVVENDWFGGEEASKALAEQQALAAEAEAAEEDAAEEDKDAGDADTDEATEEEAPESSEESGEIEEAA